MPPAAPIPCAVIGTGAMGAALARALLKKGHAVAAWNRTPAKAEALVADGATAFATPAGAIAASGAVFSVLGDVDAFLAILKAPEAADAAKSKVLVNFATCTPAEARELDARCAEIGARLVDGKLFFYPLSAGTQDAAIALSGPTDAYEAVLAPLETMGVPTHYGTAIGTAAAVDLAMLNLSCSVTVAAAHAARFAEAEGVPLPAIAGVLRGVSGLLGAEVDRIVEKIGTGDFAGTEVSVATWHGAASKVVAHAETLKIPGGFAESLVGLWQKGVDMGIGGEDAAALVKVLRNG
ncbi:hypothetical protein DFJ74DRAFT_238949 [Hyaloraphidium curvatum]|nr:hypothetical protein DFJ74DRAFT_238949 [Hyaloraphidium curvatum]